MSIQRSIALLGTVLALGLSGCVMDATEADEGFDSVAAESSELDIVGSADSTNEAQGEEKPGAERRSSGNNPVDGLYPLAEPDPEPWMHDE